MSADPNTGGGAGTGPGGGAGTSPQGPPPPPPPTKSAAVDELITLLARIAPLASRAAELAGGLVLPDSLPRPAEAAASAMRLQLALRLAVDAIAELRAAAGSEGGSLLARRDLTPIGAGVATTGGPGPTLPSMPPVPPFVASRRRLAELGVGPLYDSLRFAEGEDRLVGRVAPTP